MGKPLLPLLLRIGSFLVSIVTPSPVLVDGADDRLPAGLDRDALDPYHLCDRSLSQCRPRALVSTVKEHTSPSPCVSAISRPAKVCSARLAWDGSTSMTALWVASIASVTSCGPTSDGR